MVGSSYDLPECARCLCEFRCIEDELRKCRTKQELAALNTRWKPFKTALGDLLTMSKGAQTRATATLKKVQETAESQKKRELDKKQSEEALASKRRKAAMPIPVSLFEHTVGVEFSHHAVDHASLTVSGDYSLKDSGVSSLSSCIGKQCLVGASQLACLECQGQGLTENVENSEVCLVLLAFIALLCGG